MIWPFRPRERIVAAAVQIDGLTISLLPPARHAECLRLAAAMLGGAALVPDGTSIIVEPRVITPDRQGFVTSRQRFVGREEGKEIARKAGQLLPTHSSSQHLFSEDLW